MKIALCDDCMEDICYLKKIILECEICPGDVKFFEFSSGENLLKDFSDFNLIFLDMKLDGMSGIQIAGLIRLRDPDVPIVFYTNYDISASKVIKIRPIHYLMKNSGADKNKTDIHEIIQDVCERENLPGLYVTRVFLLIIQDILRFVIIQLIKYHHIPYEYSSYKYTKNLYILPVTTMILFNGFIASDKQPYGDILIVFGSIMIIISNITIFYVIEKLFHAQNIIKDNEKLFLKNRLEQQHFERMEKINEDYASYIHDMRHVLKTIASLAETEDNEEVKKVIPGSVRILKSKIYRR